MTLIEVVGGMGLLATLLVAVLLAKGRFTRQAATADRRLMAVAAADALLTAWHQGAVPLPRAGTGIVPGEHGFSWRTQRVANAAINEMDADVVRVEIIDNRADGVSDPVLTSVEFVVESDAKKNEPGIPQPAARQKRRSAGAKK